MSFSKRIGRIIEAGAANASAEHAASDAFRLDWAKVRVIVRTVFEETSNAAWGQIRAEVEPKNGSEVLVISAGASLTYKLSFKPNDDTRMVICTINEGLRGYAIRESFDLESLTPQVVEDKTIIFVEVLFSHLIKAIRSSY